MVNCNLAPNSNKLISMSMKPIHAPFILAVAGFAITSCVITEIQVATGVVRSHPLSGSMRCFLARM